MLLSNLPDISIEDGDAIDNISSIFEAIKALSFEIPEQVYQAFEVLTKVVGYIMPLRLYTPIITLILGYWLIMIMGAAVKFVFNLVKRLAAFFV